MARFGSSTARHPHPDAHPRPCTQLPPLELQSLRLLAQQSVTEAAAQLLLGLAKRLPPGVGGPCAAASATSGAASAAVAGLGAPSAWQQQQQQQVLQAVAEEVGGAAMAAAHCAMAMISSLESLVAQLRQQQQLQPQLLQPRARLALGAGAEGAPPAPPATGLGGHAGGSAEAVSEAQEEPLLLPLLLLEERHAEAGELGERAAGAWAEACRACGVEADSTPVSRAAQQSCRELQAAGAGRPAVVMAGADAVSAPAASATPADGLSRHAIELVLAAAKAAAPPSPAAAAAAADMLAAAAAAAAAAAVTLAEHLGAPPAVLPGEGAEAAAAPSGAAAAATYPSQPVPAPPPPTTAAEGHTFQGQRMLTSDVQAPSSGTQQDQGDASSGGRGPAVLAPTSRRKAQAAAWEAAKLARGPPAPAPSHALVGPEAADPGSALHVLYLLQAQDKPQEEAQHQHPQRQQPAAGTQDQPPDHLRARRYSRGQMVELRRSTLGVALQRSVAEDLPVDIVVTSTTTTSTSTT